MNESDKATIQARARQLAGSYIIAASLRNPEAPAIPAIDVLVERIQEGMREAFILGALGPDHVPVSRLEDM